MTAKTRDELYLAMRVVEEMPASEAQTKCISRLSNRMRFLVSEYGKSEVGKSYVPRSAGVETHTGTDAAQSHEERGTCAPDGEAEA